MKLKTVGINLAASILLDSKFWNKVKSLVTDVMNNDNLTSDAKREKVKNDLLSIFGDISNSIINLAIELAVNWVKSRQ